MKQSEIQIGCKYLFVNNGNREHKKPFDKMECTVIARVKGKKKTYSNYRGGKGNSPDKFLLDIGIYANASNLKLLTKQQENDKSKI